MNILITGGAGYIGSILTPHLLKSNFKVTVIDSLLYGQSISQKHSSSQFKFIKGDVRDKPLIQEEIKKADIIIPLAAIVGAPACEINPQQSQEVNFESIKTLLSLKKPSQLLIYPTTNSGYGTKSGDLYCDETTPLEPISYYGRTKVAAEKLVLKSPNSTTLRLATVFGMSPRMRLDLIVNYFTHQAITSGKIEVFEKHHKRNFVHINDVAECFEFAINNAAKMTQEPFNVGLENANLSKEELAQKVKEQIPNFEIVYSDSGRDPDQRNYIVSHKKIKDIGFEAKLTLETGIKELINGIPNLGKGKHSNI